jgi:hypothetical protein
MTISDTLQLIDIAATLLLSFVLGAATVYFARKQYQLEQRRSRHEVRKEYLDIYLAIMDVVGWCWVFQKFKFTDRSASRLLDSINRIRQEEYLFEDQRGREYIAKISKYATRVDLVHKQAKRLDEWTEEKMEEWSQNAFNSSYRESIEWLASQEKTVRDIFKPYLDIKF